MAIQMACSNCGSVDIKADAWAEWDFNAQQWVLSQTFDATHCEDCEGEASCDEHDQAEAFPSVERDDDDFNKFRGVVRRGDAVIARTEDVYDSSFAAFEAAGDLDVEC